MFHYVKTLHTLYNLILSGIIEKPWIISFPMIYDLWALSSYVLLRLIKIGSFLNIFRSETFLCSCLCILIVGQKGDWSTFQISLKKWQFLWVLVCKVWEISWKIDISVNNRLIKIWIQKSFVHMWDINVIYIFIDICHIMSHINMIHITFHFSAIYMQIPLQKWLLYRKIT